MFQVNLPYIQIAAQLEFKQKSTVPMTTCTYVMRGALGDTQGVMTWC